MSTSIDIASKVVYTLHVAKEATKMNATSQTTKETLNELMSKWNSYRSKWIATYGTDDGFGAWFSRQLGLEVI